jgi:hypothetical protein
MTPIAARQLTSFSSDLCALPAAVALLCMKGDATLSFPVYLHSADNLIKLTE